MSNQWLYSFTGPTFFTVAPTIFAEGVPASASSSSPVHSGAAAPLRLAGDAHVVVEGELVAVEHGGPGEAVSGHGALAAGLHLQVRSLS